ncbi:hypothetical protein IAR55_003611 [Kwoniella newhampshirensis]|uniref:Uncharacterized protein n=1 Tax=Kwoniella newhampshirensis TaxID=1651941 RepID=A0AAW0YYX8_9TREE
MPQDMHESMKSRAKEYEGVLDRNRVLQYEVDGLRERPSRSAVINRRLMREETGVFPRQRSRRKRVRDVRQLTTLIGNYGKLQLGNSSENFGKLQLSTNAILDSKTTEIDTLQNQLRDEGRKREEAEREVEMVKSDLERLTQDRMGCVLVAREKGMQRMSEVRLQALTQENVYWRQFALACDTRRFDH